MEETEGACWTGRKEETKVVVEQMEVVKMEVDVMMVVASLMEIVVVDVVVVVVDLQGRMVVERVVVVVDLVDQIRSLSSFHLING